MFPHSDSSVADRYADIHNLRLEQIISYEYARPHKSGYAHGRDH
jgi:hypothetical protein